MSRALAASTPLDERLAVANTFGRRMVAAWWGALTTTDVRPLALRAPLREFIPAQLTEPALLLADRIGCAAASVSPEAAAHQIGLAYTGMLPPEHRARYGIYYTPPALTARLIAQATKAGVDWTCARVLDPACGGGAFLTPAAQQIIASLHGRSPQVILENISARLRGYEVDPFGAWLSQVALDATLLPFSRQTGERSPAVVIICDSLHQGLPHKRFDLVIGNPPYGRVRLEPEDRFRFRRSLYGHANLYGLFTDIALSHTEPGGVIAYVTPTSFLAGEYFKNLRALLGREAAPATIDFVSVRKGVFEDVLQETLLATYRRGARSNPITTHEITPSSGSGLTVAGGSLTDLPVDRSQPWLLPRNPLQANLVNRLTKMTHRLTDWGYSVSTGPLVWNRHKDQLAHQPGHNCRPLIWAESITSDGCFVFRAIKKNHAPYFELREGDDWLVTDKPCVLLQRTTAKEQARRLIAACLPSSFLAEHRGSVIVENHLNMLRPLVEHPPVATSVLTAFLNSAAADRAFRCISGSVAVSAYELEALPLPPPEELEELACQVHRASGRDRIEEACALLYDRAA